MRMRSKSWSETGADTVICIGASAPVNVGHVRIYDALEDPLTLAIVYAIASALSETALTVSAPQNAGEI